MNKNVRRTVLAVAILGMSSSAWSAPRENLIDDPLTEATYFMVEDAELKFRDTSYTFLAESDGVRLYGPGKKDANITDGFFNLVATIDPMGTSASGYFSLVSAGTGRQSGFDLDPGLLFSGEIADVGWSESRGLLEFAANNLKGQFCDFGWCSTIQRLSFNTNSSDYEAGGLNLGLLDDMGEFRSFTQAASGLAVLNGAGVPPAAVPVPAAVWLLGSGLAGMLGFARRRSKLA